MMTGKRATITVVNEKTFEREVVRAELPVLIEFWASWCDTCRQLEPDLAGAAQELDGRAKVVKVDVDYSQAVTREFQIRTVPSYAVVARGRVVANHTGPLMRLQMIKLVEPFLPRSEAALRVEEMVQLAKEGRVLAVDTRDASSYARAHVPGAVHVPLAELENRLPELSSMGQAPVLYCRSGEATKELAEKLDEQGFPVAFLEGGFLAWELSGQPIERQ